jgi:phosphoglycolate phosphatase
MSTTIRAALFDLDGTLVDSLADLADAVNHMLSSFDRPTLPLADVRLLIGKGARNLVCRALASNDEAEIEEGLTRFLEYNHNHIVDKSRLYPGVRESLQSLAARNISLAAVSNKNEALCRLILEELGIAPLFKAVCGGDTFAEMKPSPLPLLNTVEQLALPPGSAVMVGDSINDIQAGIRAGITTIGCNWGYGAPEELQEAHYRADSCPEVTRVILGETPQ